MENDNAIIELVEEMRFEDGACSESVKSKIRELYGQEKLDKYLAHKKKLNKVLRILRVLADVGVHNGKFYPSEGDKALVECLKIAQESNNE